MLPLVAFDWSRARGLTVTFDGLTTITVATFEELLKMLVGPHLIVCESTFESYQRERREQLIEMMRSSEHELWFVSSRLTVRRAIEFGLIASKDEKSDEADARAIWLSAQRYPESLIRARVPEPQRTAVRDEINRIHTLERGQEINPQLALRAEAVLGPYRALADSSHVVRRADGTAAEVVTSGKLKRLVLGSSGHYSAVVLAAIWRAAQHTTSRAAFEDLLGLHGNGYSSHLRSDIAHWLYLMRNGGLGYYMPDKRLTWTELRRVLRWAYQEIKRARELDELVYSPAMRAPG